ncbi:MAG: carbohydrate kinase family protein [Patescibacteria group bacterium]
MFDVITIGSATRDAFFEVDFETIPWPKTPSGKAYALPLGEKFDVENKLFTIGGNSANASVTFARQGFKVACVAKVGCDVSGEEIRRRLVREGVDARYMSCTDKAPTAYSVLLTQGGERTIMGYHGASDLFSIKDVELKNLDSKWWYVSLAGESHSMFSSLVSYAKKNNISVAFNPSGYHLRHKRSEIIRLIKYISFLVLNDEEAAFLTGIPWKRQSEVFKKLDQWTPGILAVTSGRDGAVISDGKNIYRAGIFKERKLVDRTGAGDAFGSGFVAGLLKGQESRVKGQEFTEKEIAYAIRLATANSTSVVEKFGATEGTLTTREFTQSRWKNLPIKVTRI